MLIKKINYSWVYLVILLIFFNTVSHFLPFERRALAPDDYQALVNSKSVKRLSDIPYQMLDNANRPLNHAVLMLQSKFVADNAGIALWVLFISTTFCLLAIFFLFNQLFNNEFIAFIASIMFCLLPNKLETYHTLLYFNINVVITLYVLSLVFFIVFLKNSKRINLVLSLFFYSISIFWYEVGFFMPIIMAAYAYVYKRDKIKSAFYFLLPASFYIIFRLTGAFGFGSLRGLTHKVDISKFPINPLTDLFHQYLGRYMVRNLIYGLYKFFSIEQPWLIIIIISDIIFLIILERLIRKHIVTTIDKYLPLFSGVLFIIFIMPLFLSNGGIAGRHLVLPSIGIVIFVLWLLQKTKNKWRAFFLLLVIPLLIICQGNTWAQVIACRINRAIYETMKEKKRELSQAERIIIDTRSFADNINFTLINRDFNILNTYYGAQTFEEWGLTSMARLIIDDIDKHIYISAENPTLTNEGTIKLETNILVAYRKVVKKEIFLPKEKTAIIDFESVFGGNFNNGIRK